MTTGSESKVPVGVLELKLELMPGLCFCDLRQREQGSGRRSRAEAGADAQAERNRHRGRHQDAVRAGEEQASRERTVACIFNLGVTVLNRL